MESEKTRRCGRVSEFDERSYGEFLEEARGQHFSAAQLERALDLIAGTSGPGDAGRRLYESLQRKNANDGESLDAVIELVTSMTIMDFRVAVNFQTGIRRRNFW